jgi:hypothetical protein
MFEQKEYAENYVMERLAREMLMSNPNLQKELEELKKNQPEIAQNQWAILNWFYRKTPWWDANMNVYPVGRVYTKEILDNILH